MNQEDAIPTAELVTISLYKAREKEYESEILVLKTQIETLKEVNGLQRRVIELLEER